VLWVAAILIVSGTSFSGGEQAAPSAPPTKQDAQPARVKVYSVGPDVTAPELLPPLPFRSPADKCKYKLDGDVVLSVLVDETGKPRNIMFLQPLGTDLDKFALQVVDADRFKPGTHEGAPVVVAQSIKVGIHACVESKKDPSGNMTSWLQLRSQPVQKLGNVSSPTQETVLTTGDSTVYKPGNGITYPELLKHAEARFSDEAIHAKQGGSCIISFLVDEHGMPQDFLVVQGLGYGLTEKALEAVRQYRFKPAMKDGQPVRTTLSVAIDFHLY